jgi:hypothetical protein
MTSVRASLLFLVLFATYLGADVRITETVVAKAGDRSQPAATRVTAVQGNRMRIDHQQDKESASTLYDLNDSVTIALDTKKKRADVRAMAERNAKLEKLYPRARTTTTLTATGTRRDVAGVSCGDHTFSVRVPLTKDESIAFMLTGSACVAADAPGAGDYLAFARAAIDRQLLLGPASDNRLVLALVRAQTELYRALADAGGIPFVVDMNMAVDGKGMLAGMVRKLLSGSRTSTVTAVSAGPLDEAMFVVPAGWKRENK